jgi:hypothetical protein
VTLTAAEINPSAHLPQLPLTCLLICIYQLESPWSKPVPPIVVLALQLLPLDTSSSWQSLTSTWLAGLTSTPDGMESILGIHTAGGSC